MTEVAFHFNAPDKPAYVCRLLRKAVAQGSKIVVVAPPPALGPLDALLWTFSQTDFIAHAGPAASGHELALSPVVVCDNAARADLPHHDVLVNLCADLPQGFEAFGRLIEVVGLDEDDRDHARRRWKQYAALGYAIQRHDLNLKG